VRDVASRRVARGISRIVFTRSGGSDWIHIFVKNMHIERKREKFSLLHGHVASTMYFLPVIRFISREGALKECVLECNKIIL